MSKQNLLYSYTVNVGVFSAYVYNIYRFLCILQYVMMFLKCGLKTELYVANNSRPISELKHGGNVEMMFIAQWVRNMLI